MSPAHAHSAEVIDDIVEAARRRFGEAGYEATSIDQIAADTGRTKGAVYHHFADKRELFRRVMVTEQRDIAAAVVARAADLPSGVSVYLSTIADAPGPARVTLIDGPVVLGWEEWRACDDGPFRTLLRASLDTYGRLGERYDLDQLTELLLGAITEAAAHVVRSPNPSRTARGYAEQLEHLIAAIAPT